MILSNRLLALVFVGGVAAIATALACGRPELPIAVQKTRVGLHSDVQLGDRVELRRVASRDFAGAKPGFYALRSQYQFELFRSDLPRTHAAPPKGVRFGDEMILAGYPDAPDMDKLEINTVVDTSSGLHVYATQYTVGEGCPPPPTGTVFDMVAMPRADRPIIVHLDTDRSPACKSTPPKAMAVCRIQQTANWLLKLDVPWQSQIECELQTEPGARPIIDRNWFISEIAKGSTAKLTVSKGGTRVSFPADALGRYTIRLEAFDDEGKRGDAFATVNSVPANDDTYVQFSWSAFGPTDELETFPRLEYKLGDVGPKGNAPRNYCTAQGQHPSWCEVTTTPAVTVMKVAETPGRYGAYIRYLDDRYKGMAIACVRIFKHRQLVNEMCDDTTRKGGETWEAGIVSASAGMFEHLMPVDAGAPEAGITDASSTRTAAMADATVAATDAAAPKKATAAKEKKP
jgi:hypothetical protein